MSSVIDRIEARRDNHMFAQWGVAALHTDAAGGSYRRRVVVDRGVRRQGFDAQLVRAHTELSLLHSEGPAPRRGDVVELLDDASRYTVDAAIDDDGAVITVTVRG